MSDGRTAWALASALFTATATIPLVWRLTHCAPIPGFPSISARMSGSAGHDETSASSERTLTGAR